MSLEHIIKQLKDISFDNLSEEELEQIKEVLIKMLVDVQLQKDIVVKMKAVHLSADDMEIKIMQEVEKKDVINADGFVAAEMLEQNVVKDEKTEDVQYSEVLKEEVSEEVISIYAVGSSSFKESTTEEILDVSKDSGLKKILFSINDKFRVLKKLFKNNQSSFDVFLQELNRINELSISEGFIEKQKEHYGWDENWEEYKILLRQNKSRFR